MGAVCRACHNFINLEPGTPREHVWYNHLCRAHPFPVDVDPYDGEPKPYSHNDLGQRYFSKHEFTYCRNVNGKGECQDFAQVG